MRRPVVAYKINPVVMAAARLAKNDNANVIGKHNRDQKRPGITAAKYTTGINLPLKASRAWRAVSGAKMAGVTLVPI